MKKIALKTIIITLGLLATQSLITSCSNEDDDQTIESSEAQITEEEAIEIIETSLQANTGGLNNTTMDISQALNGEIDFDFEISCDTPIQQTFPYQFESNNVEANYLISWDYEIACNSTNIPQTSEFATEHVGSFSTVNITSSDTSTSGLSISGLQPTATSYLVSGNYGRTGTQSTSFNDYNRSFTSTFTATLTSLVISKSDYQIDSGEGTVQLTLSNTEGTETFEGSIVFNGNRQATLTINGTEYNITL